MSEEVLSPQINNQVRDANGQQPTQEATYPTPPPQTKPQSRRRFIRLLGIMLLVLAGLLAYFLAVAYLGWQTGEERRQQEEQAYLIAEINKQLQLVQKDVNDGRYALAQRRLTWILETAPNHPEAQTLQGQIQAAADSDTTAQPAIVEIIETPAPTPTPIPTVALLEDPESELTQIETLIEAEQWAEALPRITAFQRQFPSYERQKTNTFLYDAYINAGLDLLNGEQVELGLFYIAQAANLGDLSQSVLDYQTFAELYLQGIAFYGTNWGASAYHFRELCLAAPFYQSSCEWLHEVLISQGDQYAAVQEWCPAQLLYAEAQQHGQSQKLTEKEREAEEGCLSATPTPIAVTPISNTFSITKTWPITNSQPFIDLRPTPTATPEN